MKALTALFAAFFALPAHALDLVDDPQLPPGLVSAELLPGWITPEGKRITALKLQLEPGWKTYWRSPGDAGIPPRFDWQGGVNDSQVTLFWPRPEIIDTAGERSIGYHGAMLLPIEITSDQAAGLTDALTTDVEFGLCLNICVPAHVTLTAPLPGAAPDPAIEHALQQVPPTSPLTPSCEIKPIEDGMRVTATLPITAQHQDDDIAMELRDDLVWVSQPEVQTKDGKIMATADFIDETGKPFALNKDDLRTTLIGSEQAMQFDGCSNEG